MADCRAIQVQEQRDDEMIKANDKDAIIQHLIETLDKVDNMLSNLSLYDYACTDCDGSADYSNRFYDDIDEIHDFIWHRKADVTF